MGPPTSDRVLEALDAVVNEATFVEFLRVLTEDWERGEELEQQKFSSPYGPNATGWESATIGQFLEAAAAWAESSRDDLDVVGYPPPANPWRRCADIIFAGKVYE